MRNSTPILALLALLWIGCSRIPDVPSTPNEWWPLEPGMWWEYAETVQTYSGSTLLYEKLQPLRLEVTQRGYLNSPHSSEEEAPYAHVEVFEVRMTIPGNQTLLYLHPDTNGIYLYGRRTQVPKEEELGIEYGCELGNMGGSSREILVPFPDTYPAYYGVVPIFLFGCEADSAYAAAITASWSQGRVFNSITQGQAVVPAGSFPATKLDEAEWWVPEVGLVKSRLDFVQGQGSWQRRYVISRGLTGYGE